MKSITCRFHTVILGFKVSIFYALLHLAMAQNFCDLLLVFSNLQLSIPDINYKCIVRRSIIYTQTRNYLKQGTQTSNPATSFIAAIHIHLVYQSSCCMVFKHLQAKYQNVTKSNRTCQYIFHHLAGNATSSTAHACIMFVIT